MLSSVPGSLAASGGRDLVGGRILPGAWGTRSRANLVPRFLILELGPGECGVRFEFRRKPRPNIDTPNEIK